MKARIKFSKTGAMKYVGHLDIMRYFQKAIRRSNLPIKYSEGFNPHQIMSFAAPLGLGLTSSGEYMDIELKEQIPSAEAKAKLQETMVEGMDILEFRYLEDGAKNAMSSVSGASYELKYKHKENFESISLQDLLLAKESFYDNATTIPIIKKTKKGEREVDLRPLIFEFEIKEDDMGDILFYLFVSTGSVDNIKPELVLEHFFSSMDVIVDENTFFIHRLDMFTTEDDRFVSLGDVGYDYA